MVVVAVEVEVMESSGGKPLAEDIMKPDEGSGDEGFIGGNSGVGEGIVDKR